MEATDSWNKGGVGGEDDGDVTNAAADDNLFADSISVVFVGERGCSPRRLRVDADESATLPPPV